MYECLSLLCGGEGAQGCGGGVVGGGKFAHCDAFVERLSFRLEQDRAQQKRVRIHHFGKYKPRVGYTYTPYHAIAPTCTR